MAINFEAANMAGYNNPKIEVFKAAMEPTTYKITDAPSKPEIIRCLRRGAIPAILETTPDGSEGNMFWMLGWVTENKLDTLVFGAGSHQIIYPFDSDTPTFVAGG